MKLKQLYKRKANWTQNTLARDKEGKETEVNSPEAVSWCIIGAMLKCYSVKEYLQVQKLILKELKLDNRSYFNPLVEWNNDPKTKFTHLKRLVNKLNI